MSEETGSSNPHALLTIAELAKRFSLPESTARYYCKRFLAYLPHVGEGKRRRYRNEASEIFAHIVSEMKKSKNAMAVEASLSHAFRSTPNAAELAVTTQHTIPTPAAQVGSTVITSAQGGVDPSHFITLMEQQTQAMQSIAESLTSLKKSEDRVVELEERLTEKESEISSLQNEMESLRTMQGESEKLHQQDFEQLRKWLNRIASEKQS